MKLLLLTVVATCLASVALARPPSPNWCYNDDDGFYEATDCTCEDGGPCFDENDERQCSRRRMTFTCNEGDGDTFSRPMYECPDRSALQCTCTDGGEDCTDFIPKELIKLGRRGGSRDSGEDEDDEEAPCEFSATELTCEDSDEEPEWRKRPRFVPVMCREDNEEEEEDFDGDDDDDDESDESDERRKRGRGEVTGEATCTCGDTDDDCYDSEDEDSLPTCPPNEWVLSCPAGEAVMDPFAPREGKKGGRKGGKGRKGGRGKKRGGDRKRDREDEDGEESGRSKKKGGNGGRFA